MSKKSSRSYLSRLRKPLVVNPIVALLFILAFVGISGYAISQSSLAASYICYNHSYYDGGPQDWGGNCTKYIQRLLNGVTNTNGDYPFAPKYHGTILTVDGDFGPLTEAQVEHFQGYFGLAKTGRVLADSSTWSELCHWGGATTDGYNAAIAAGCFK
jgi:hypothetical protein